MEIRVGTPLRKKYVNPVAALREQTNQVWPNPDPNRKYEIIGVFTGTHWPLGLGFRRLGEFLVFLGNNEIGYGRWESLTISLPDIELPYDGPSLPILPLDAFANLQHLTWKGHRQQLLWARAEATEWQYAPVFLLPEDIQISDYVVGPESPSYAIPSSVDVLTLPATTQSTTDVPTLSFESSQISDYILGLENPSDAASSTDAPTLSAATQSTANVSTSSFESSQTSDYILEPESPSYATSNADVPTLLATPHSTADVSTLSFESSQLLEVAERRCLVQLDADEPEQNLIIVSINQQKTFEFIEECYQDCKQRFDNLDVSRLEVKATINPGSDWSLSTLGSLGRALVNLRQDDQRRLCKTLNVKLPVEDQDKLKSNGEVVDLSLPNIESLIWESHRNQLPLIGLQNFTHLTRLEITSCLSMRDCELLLQRTSGTLQFCKIQEVIDDDAMDIFPQDINTTGIESVTEDTPSTDIKLVAEDAHAADMNPVVEDTHSADRESAAENSTDNTDAGSSAEDTDTDSELAEDVDAYSESADTDSDIEPVEVENVDGDWKLVAPEPRIQMRSLESLSIHSDFRSDLMLNKFELKSLRFLELKVKFGFLNPTKYMEHIPWSQLDEVHLDYDFVHKDVTWVEQKAPNAIRKIVHTNMII
ncbi:hypothetical protein C0989_001182 [Termitomyces sp. Mn162]|nr:hypothetical protein C0989_001182 [Termitomyces sp. Mn162]